MCRLRKIKCSEGSRNNVVFDGSLFEERPKCQPCQEAELDCHWDTIDRRRGQRLNLSAACDRPQTRNPMPDASEIAVSSLSGGEAPGDGFDLDLWADLNNNSIASATNSDEATAQVSVLDTSTPDLQNLVFDFWLPEDWTNLTFDSGLRNGERDKKPSVIRMRCYRRCGPTAIVPGLRRLALVVDAGEEEQSDLIGDQLTTEDRRILDSSSPPLPSEESKLFDKSGRQPHPEILPQILNVFFEHLGGHFPFLSHDVLDSHVRSQVASSFLLNAIAALALRFCPFDGPMAAIQGNCKRNGSPFLEKAKEQLVSLLSIPEPEVVAGLVLLAWAELGDSNETGLWMFAGMAIRMVQDLGFHRTPETDSDLNFTVHDHARPARDGTYLFTHEQSTLHQQKARLVMFWSVFLLDVYVSLVTGRPPTFRRNEIEVAVPSYSDMKLAQLDFEKDVSMANMIFPVTVGFMILFSEATELLNQPILNGNADDAAAKDREAALVRTTDAMILQYNMLPCELVFNVENLRASSSSAQSGLFLTLHLFFYAIMALASNTSSREKQSLHSAQNPYPSPSHHWQVSDGELQSGITMMACQKIVQISSITREVDRMSYLTSPFTHHCFFVAASAILRSTSAVKNARETNARPLSSGFFGLTADADFQHLCHILREQAEYFAGVKFVLGFLERKRLAIMNGELDGHRIGIDETGDDDLRRVVTIDDTGIVNRYSIPGTGSGISAAMV